MKIFFLLLICCLFSLVACGGRGEEKSTSGNNWAVLVSTSRWWYNYRHVANTLSFYHTVKRLGIPDSQIILMLADDVACNARNVYPGQVFNNRDHRLNLYGDDVEVDYRDYDVTVENLIRILTDRHAEDVPRSKRLLTDENSNILVYLTGHGGDEFIKFQDAEEINSHDLADAFAQMHQKKRYKEIFFVADTCQAATLYKHFYSPNIIAVGSSLLGENSYSHHTDSEVGVAVIDRFTYFTLQFLEKVSASSTDTLGDLLDFVSKQPLNSHLEVRSDLSSRDVHSIPITDFFASVNSVLPHPVRQPDVLAFSSLFSSK